MLLAILVLSIAIQFCAAGLALLLVRRAHPSSAWVFLAVAFFLMGVRRALSLASSFSQESLALDPVAESVSLLVSILLLAGVWKIRGVFDSLNRLRVNAEEQAEKRKQAEAELTVSLREAVEATARQRESEERMRFLGDNLPGVLLYQIDCGEDGRDRRFTYLSRGVEEIHEIPLADALESPFAIYTQLSEEDCRPYAEMERLAIENQSLFCAETRINLPSGKTKWIQIASAPRRTSSNHLVWDGFEVDITDRKRLEEELLRHSETLEKAVADRTVRLQSLAAELVRAEQRERRRLSDFLHDDLQQVLFAARFIAQKLVADHSADSGASDLCRLRDLMGEALNKTRTLSKDLVTPLLYEVGLVSALRQMAAQMRERYGLDVAFDAQDRADVKEEALKVQLFHSLRELLFNAAKHSGAKAARLRGWAADGRILFSVEDEGKGFDTCGVLNGASTEHGCGLFSICERIKALGGTVTVDSSPGRGTRVTISLPDLLEQEPAPQTAQALSSAEGAAAGSGGRARVLVVDDHELLRQGVVRLLSKDDSLDVVGEATGGREAISLARQLRPDVVIMDVRMPDMGGAEATRLICSELPDVVVIGLSAFVDEGFKTEMLNAGSMALLDKADVCEMLRGMIVECLARRAEKKSL